MRAAELVVCERAGENDLRDLQALESEAGRTPWSPPQLRAAVSGDAQAVLLLSAYRRCAQGPERELLAACAVQLVADELEIHDLTVRQSRRREGLGRALLVATLSWAAHRGAQQAHLEVRAGNGPALALYGAAGFRQTGRRRGYYRQPEEDALLLARGLEAGPGKPGSIP